MVDFQNIDDEALIRIWLNCHRKINKGSIKDATLMMNKVENEWSRRRAIEERRQARSIGWNFYEIPERGLLKTLGYSVGENGAPVWLRQAILRRIADCELPFVDSSAYTNSWGSPRSRERMRRVITSLQGFLERGRMNVRAARDWQVDIAFLSKLWEEKFGVAEAAE